MRSYPSLIAVLLAFGGCVHDAADEEESTDVADAATGINHDDPFFTEAHPQTGSFTTSAGESVPLPIAFYDLSGWVAYGTIDAAAARTQLAGTGLQPLLTDGERAFGMFFIQDVRDSGLRRFRSTEFYVLASANGETLPWVNDFTSLAAAELPTTLSVHADGMIDGGRAGRVYREYFGIDTRGGRITTSTSRTSVAFSVTELGPRGALAVTGRLPNSVAPADQGAAVVGLAQAFGLPGPQSLPPTPPELRFNFAVPTSDGHRTYHVFSKHNVAFRAFDATRDRLELGGGRYAATIAGFDFRPTVVLVNARVMDSADLDP
jgi:hypothetical protein